MSELRVPGGKREGHTYLHLVPEPRLFEFIANTATIKRVWSKRTGWRQAWEEDLDYLRHHLGTGFTAEIASAAPQTEGER